MEIELRGKAEAQSAGKIVAIGAAARPLPLEAVFEFNHAALGGVGGTGYGGPAGN